MDTFRKSELDSRTDEELLAAMRESPESAGGITEYLCDKYKTRVRARARKMFLLGGDTEDLIQEGMIGLFQAVRDFDFGRDASFATFAELCIARKMYSAIQAAGREKHAPLNNYISLYEKFGEAGDVELQDVLPAQDGDPEMRVLSRENLSEIWALMETELSAFERQALELHLTGATSGEVARILGKDAKSTDNAIQRARGKLQKSIKGA